MWLTWKSGRERLGGGLLGLGLLSRTVIQTGERGFRSETKVLRSLLKFVLLFFLNVQMMVRIKWDEWPVAGTAQ